MEKITQGTMLDDSRFVAVIVDIEEIADILKRKGIKNYNARARELFDQYEFRQDVVDAMLYNWEINLENGIDNFCDKI